MKSHPNCYIFEKPCEYADDEDGCQAVFIEQCPYDPKPFTVEGH